MSKISIPSNATVVPVPEDLRNRDGGLYINTITIEGTKDHDKKLVIKHRAVYGRNRSPDKIVVQLRGSATFEAWEEFEGADLEAQYESNFISILNEDPKRQLKFHYKSASLYAYIREYFLENENGKHVMELIRRKNQQINQKLDRGVIPDYDTIVRKSCEHLRAKYHIVTLWETGEMLYYKDGRYVYGAERIIEEECFALFQYDARTYMIEEVKKAVRRQTYHELSEFDSDLNIINVKNGLYHIKEKKLTDHTPDYLSLNQKPITYDPTAKCPAFEKFLSDVLYPQQIKTAKQFEAYIFYRATPHEVYLIQVGHGWNGKTKLNNVMVRLHGEENVSYVPFNDIAKDPFALADLERKDMNIDNEPSGGVIKSSAILKKLSGHDWIRVQQKYIKAHNVKLHAKLRFSTNDIPDIQDESIGRYRREIVITFPYTFKPNPNPNNPMEKLEDPDIEEKLTTEAELSGIFKMLMDELHDILYKQKKRLHIDMSNIEERRRHREMLKNPVQFFVEDVIDLDNSNSDSYIRKDDLYLIYEKFSELNRIAPEDKDIFGKKLKNVLKESIIDGKREPKAEADPITGKRRTIWKGIKVKEEWKDDDKREKQTSLLTRREEEDGEEEEQKQEEHKEGEHQPNANTENKDVEKAVSDQSDVSDQDSEKESPKGENNVVASDISRSKVRVNDIDFVFGSLSKHENGLTGLTPNVSIDCSSIDIDGIIKIAMRDKEGNPKEYFTKDDWLFTCQMYPNLHCSIEQSEQVLNQLLQENKIVKLGEDKYQPTTEKS